MQKKTKRIFAAAVMAALPVIGVATATSASAGSGDTPDNHTEWVDSWPNNRGYVMWNDYADSDHSHDLDDIWLTDKKGDGESVELIVYRDGEPYRTVNASYGETEKVYLWNANNGEKVFWKACAVFDDYKICSDVHYFQE